VLETGHELTARAFVGEEDAAVVDARRRRQGGCRTECRDAAYARRRTASAADRTGDGKEHPGGI
jgi:hypothetical protein